MQVLVVRSMFRIYLRDRTYSILKMTAKRRKTKAMRIPAMRRSKATNRKIVKNLEAKAKTMMKAVVTLRMKMIVTTIKMMMKIMMMMMMTMTTTTMMMMMTMMMTMTMKMMMMMMTMKTKMIQRNRMVIKQRRKSV